LSDSPLRLSHWDNALSLKALAGNATLKSLVSLKKYASINHVEALASRARIGALEISA
jgi:hypothetical protein